jgi:hypothetical protein
MEGNGDAPAVRMDIPLMAARLRTKGEAVPH